MANKTLAFEIGTEELPAFDLAAATKQLETLARTAFDNSAIPYEKIEIFTTPRRLITLVSGMPEMTEAKEEVFRGPSAKIAFDADGNLTKAALGFARGKGVDPEALERRDENGVEYIYAVKSTPAKSVADLLPTILIGLIEGLSWPRSQRWGDRNEYFVRPVRWLLAMLGDTIVPVEWAGLTANNQTYGHRFLAAGPHTVATADELLPVLRANRVVTSQAEREAAIREQIKVAEEKTGLVAELPAKTLQEVINLAEFPVVMVGEFDEKFLAVPKEITVDAMLVHQRYFPLFNQDGTLSNKFLITSNGDERFEANIIDGNQRVVAARLYDAKFFYDEDLKKPLEAYVEGLEEVVFQEQLGTVAAKTRRITALAEKIAAQANLSGQDAVDAKRAAYLCKADLITGAVVEFTSVQGIMGCYYAKAAGETDQVAQAIADHYRPRFAGDEPPASAVGQVVAMSDKLDTICGMFAINQGPTGTSDPFALRRSAIGIVSILSKLPQVSLVAAIDDALAIFAENGLEFDIVATKAAVVDFFVTRSKVMIKDAGNGVDAIEAVMAVDVTEPMEMFSRVAALETARKEMPEDFANLATAYARANNLRDAEAGIDYDEAALSEIQAALSCAIVEAETKVAKALGEDDYQSALTSLAALRAPIDQFFDKVMVKDEDLAVRANNMKLLNRFVNVFANVADFGKLVKSGK